MALLFGLLSEGIALTVAALALLADVLMSRLAQLLRFRRNIPRAAATALAGASAMSAFAWAQSGAERTYTAEEVACHGSMANGVWVTLGDGVYDVTDFVRHHPGGDHILAAGGGPLEPFWAQWQVHLTSKVMDHLQPLRIGRLSPSDRLAGIFGIADPYDDEPERDPRLGVLGARPFDSETALEALRDAFHTPQALFFVRNHLPVPRIDEAEHRLTIELGDGRRRSLSMDELRALPQTRVDATLQCTGNRCNEIDSSVAGGIGQIGNASWEGVRLRDLLLAPLPSPTNASSAEGVVSQEPAKQPTRQPPLRGHLHAVGRDGYEVSIPLDKVMDERGGVLLAHSMNGEPLSRDHGAPLRLLVPGFVGARSVKWLSHLRVEAAESSSVWQERYYRIFPPWVRDIRDIDYHDHASAPPVYEFPVQSAIVAPADGEAVRREADGAVEVRGYAVSGAGQRVMSVRLSTDGGDNWRDAALQRSPEHRTVATAAADTTAASAAEPPGRTWSWVLWSARVPVPPGGGEVRLRCKAIDSAYNSQPERADYNLRGYLSNAQPNVMIRVIQ